MSNSRSDALIIFGATGDLAYKKIFPALQALVKRGRLDAPVIGVARSEWTVDQFRERARKSLEAHGGVDPVAFPKLSELLRYVPGEYNDRTAGEVGDYERVLGAAMEGDTSLFARQDYVEEAWRIVDPVLKSGTRLYQYEPNSWGPSEVERVTPPGGWHNPGVERKSPSVMGEAA